MGNFYVESKMESGTYDINFHKTIGLTNDEYVNNVNIFWYMIMLDSA